MKQTMMCVAAAATLLSACGPKAADEAQGPVVSASETPRNEAVDTTPTAGDTGPTPGANSFTEGQARNAIEAAGYGSVSPLTQDANGVWTGKASKGGVETSVSVDYKGAVTAS